MNFTYTSIKTASLSCLAFFCICYFSFISFAEEEQVIKYPNSTNISLKASQVVVIDYSTGKVLLEKNAHNYMTPSSMTKIMTSYIIEEKIKKGDLSLNSEFTVSEKAWKMGGSKSFMPLGKKVHLKDVLYGIIIQSGNDASIVAAEGISGSELDFVDIMNSKAQEMGMKNTNFVNSTGWPLEDHYSTAYDIAILGKALIKDHPEFYPIYSKKEFTFGKDQNGVPITQGNRNPLLYKDLGCDGIKTGYTSKGGYGLVASFTHEGRRYIFVVNGLNSIKERSLESEKILHWVKRNFVNKRFYTKGDIIKEVPVWLGQKNKVNLVLTKNVESFLLRSKKNAEIQTEFDVNLPLSAPFNIGDIVGKAIFTVDDEIIEVPVTVDASIKKAGFLRQVISYIGSIF